MHTTNLRRNATWTAALLVAALDAGATTITFDNLAIGTTLSNQYAGVVFAPNAFSGASPPGDTWATNTDMTIVSATGSDVGTPLGTPSLVSGNVLRSFNGWLDENGDPSFRVSFATAINSFSADFAGVSMGADVRLFIYNGSSLLGTVAGPSSNDVRQLTLAYAAPQITSVVVTPGDGLDYVAFDNMQYQTVVTAVPEPGTWAMAGVGIMVLSWATRRKLRPQAREKPASA